MILSVTHHLPLDTAQCGLSSYLDAGIEGGTIPTPSIVNGWEAREHEFPWQVI